MPVIGRIAIGPMMNTAATTCSAAKSASMSLRLSARSAPLGLGERSLLDGILVRPVDALDRGLGRRTRADLHLRQQDVQQRADGQGVDHRADADHPAEQPAHGQHREFDHRANQPDRADTTGDQTGHQPAPRYNAPANPFPTMATTSRITRTVRSSTAGTTHNVASTATPMIAAFSTV